MNKIKDKGKRKYMDQMSAHIPINLERVRSVEVTLVQALQEQMSHSVERLEPSEDRRMGMAEEEYHFLEGRRAQKQPWPTSIFLGRQLPLKAFSQQAMVKEAHMAGPLPKEEERRNLAQSRWVKNGEYVSSLK
ncbi:hypothetical protein LIER_42987 [Lithospermum erythrorhizon]|uniref:Uncharacterized protein n=1 Tax=Lithospermum erythrorhizon TaxID=34254 RepID=A0AAV3PD84_LITER